MSEYKYENLMEMNMTQLITIREHVRNNLSDLQKEKMILCGNILSIQALIKAEKETSPPKE